MELTDGTKSNIVNFDKHKMVMMSSMTSGKSVYQISQLMKACHSATPHTRQMKVYNELYS